MAAQGRSACLRALQRQSHSLCKAPAARRSFTSTVSARAGTPSDAPGKSAQPQPAAPQPSSGSLSGSLLSSLQRAAPTYTAYGVTENLFKQCSEQADYSIPQAQDENADMPKTADGEDLGIGDGWWHKELGLSPTFSAWSQVAMLHMYLLSARMRCFSAADAKLWQQHLLDHFFYDAEKRMATHHNMTTASTRNKYLKDLFIQWRGLIFSYDEGLVRGDAVLASAVWRNVFKAREDVDFRLLAAVVAYMRASLVQLDKLPDEALKKGDWAFGSPSEQMLIVSRRSRMMDMPFKEEVKAK